MYQLETCRGATVLRVYGDVDFSTEGSFREMLALAQRNAVGQIVVDLEECPYFDAAGLSELVRARNAWGEDRFSVVLPEAGIVNRIFRVTGLDRVFNVERSIAAARSFDF